MPRMTPELIMLHPSYLSPLKDRELDLRGNQIPAIENLGVTKVGRCFVSFQTDTTKLTTTRRTR